MFVTIEGIDNVGKTSLCKILKKRLSTDYSVRQVSDPPGIPPWTRLRSVKLGNKKITPNARALMLLAARVDAYSRTIKPIFRGVDVVLGDRFTDSWVAYQAAMTLEHFKTRDRAISFFERI